MPRSLLLTASLMVIAAGAVAAPAPPTPAPEVPAWTYSALSWRGIGPYRGGRALAVTGIPGKPNQFLFGAAAGGVWKSVDSGGHWTPIFDGQAESSIGAIAVAPSNPDVIYVGTGEAALRGDITWGGGVYKSIDGGKTWSFLGLKDSRHIGAIAVDPTNPDIVLVAALGHAFGPNAERGVYRSTDGGKTWIRTLYKDADTGAIDVILDPHDPKVVWASLWQVRRQPWNFSSGGPGSGLYKSIDGGVNWTRQEGHGLPSGILGRIDIAPSPADPKRVFANIEAANGGLFRSDDSGATWKLINQDGRIRQRAWYFSKIYADPRNAEVVYAQNTGMLRSKDGGKSFDLVSATHGDHHALWIDPNDPDRIIDANDGGASVSLDGGATWSTQDNQPTAQFYHVAVDKRWPYWVYGAQQDNSNLAVASYSDEGVIGPRDWYPAGGGESGFVVPDPRDPMIIYSDAENQFGRYDKHREQVQDISPDGIANSGHGAFELKHRFNWTSPLMISPSDPDAIYAASEVVWKSTDKGNSWKIISPDLTRNDKTKQQPSGGPITKDITSVEYYDTIFALAESPLAKGKLWAGSDDGLVNLTVDDGGHWTNVTPKALPAWSTISMIEPSPHKAATAYLAVDRHKVDDTKPYAWRTDDDGKSWTSIAGNLPDGAVVHAVREDPARAGLLYAATEIGVFVSFDDGGRWAPLKLNMPATPVHDLAVSRDDLVAATHGRAFWILDDLTPLRQALASPEPITLYAPETAVRLYYPDQVSKRRPVGENPPAGAIIDYAFAAAPAGPVKLEILDASGQVVRHLSSVKAAKEVQPQEWPDNIISDDTLPAKPGMNRFVWDLRGDDPVQIPGAFYEDQAPRGVIQPPGRYQVRLTAGDVVKTQTLTLIADPRDGEDAEKSIAERTDLMRKTLADIDALHRAVNDVRARRKALKTNPDAARDARLASIEEALMQVKMNGSEADLQFPGMLNEQYAGFAGSLEGSDAPPTTQQLALFESLHARLGEQLAKLAADK